MNPPKPSMSSELASLAPLLLAPLTTSLVVVVAPSLPVPDALADLVAIALSVGPSLLALTLAARKPLPSARVLVLLALVCGLAIALVFARGLSLPLVPVQSGALVGLGYALGTLVGSRVAHPGHMLPAAIVASAADLASVLSPEGPSHAIASSEKALGAAALAAPVPGTAAITHVLGVGDLIMLALLFAVGARFEVRPSRIAMGAALGLVAAFACSAALAAPVPALVPISAAVVLVVPSFRKLAPTDRRTTALAAALATAVVAGVILRR